MEEIILVQEQPRGPSQLVEVSVVTGKQKIPLLDQPQLRSQEGQTIIIKAMRLITAKVLSNGMTLEGPCAPLAELQKMSLVLYSEGWLKGNMIPLLTMNDVNDSDATSATTIAFRNNATKFNNWRNVDWAQSFLLYGNGQQSASDFIVMWDVEYEKLNSQGVPIIGPS